MTAHNLIVKTVRAYQLMRGDYLLKNIFYKYPLFLTGAMEIMTAWMPLMSLFAARYQCWTLI